MYFFPQVTIEKKYKFIKMQGTILIQESMSEVHKEYFKKMIQFEEIKQLM